jgi:hypothetical protein
MLFWSAFHFGLLLIRLPIFDIIRLLSDFHYLILWFLSKPVDKFLSYFLWAGGLFALLGFIINIVLGLLHFSTFVMSIILIFLFLVVDVTSKAALEIGLLTEIPLLAFCLLGHLAAAQPAFRWEFDGIGLCWSGCTIIYARVAKPVALESAEESVHARLRQRNILFAIFRRERSLFGWDRLIGLWRWLRLWFSMLFSLFGLNYWLLFFLFH